MRMSDDDRSSTLRDSIDDSQARRLPPRGRKHCREMFNVVFIIIVIVIAAHSLPRRFIVITAHARRNSMADSEEDDVSDDHLEGVLLPTLPGAADEDDADEEEDGGGQAAGDDADADALTTAAGAGSVDADREADLPGPSSTLLPDAASAFDPESAPPGAELDPFRTTGAAQVSAQASADAGGSKARKSPAGKFDTVKYDREHLHNRKLFVGGLPPSVTEASLIKFFSRFGKVQEARLGVHHETGKSRGFAFVVFAYHKGARYCLEQGAEKEMDGARLRCEVAAAHDKNRARGPDRPAGGDRPPRPAAREREGGGWGRASGVPGSAVAAAGGSSAPDAPDADDGPSKKKRKESKQIVTITRRDDAEPAEKTKISMREIFPKVRAPCKKPQTVAWCVRAPPPTRPCAIGPRAFLLGRSSGAFENPLCAGETAAADGRGRSRWCGHRAARACPCGLDSAGLCLWPLPHYLLGLGERLGFGLSLYGAEPEPLAHVASYEPRIRLMPRVRCRSTDYRARVRCCAGRTCLAVVCRTLRY